MLKIKYCFFLLGVVLRLCTLGQAPTLINYDLSRGLPSNECYKVIQDKKGYIWVASDGGLSKYNGYSFKNYTTKDGLPDNVITHLFEGTDGGIWMVGLNSEFVLLKNDTFFVQSKLNDDLKKRIGRAHVRSLKLNNQELMIGFDQFYPYILTYSLRLNRIIKQEFVGLSNAVMYGDTCSGFVYSYNLPPHAGSFFNFSFHLPGTEFSERHYESKSGPYQIKYLWISKDSSLISIGERLLLLTASKVEVLYDYKSNIMQLYKDSRGRLWVLVYKDGVFLYDVKKIKQEQMHWFSGKSFSSVFEDSEHSFWLSSFSNGVFHIPNSDIVHYFIYENSNTVKVNAVVMAKGKVMLGGDSKYLYEYNLNFGFKKGVKTLANEIFDLKSMHSELIVAGDISHAYSHIGNGLPPKKILNSDKKLVYLKYIATDSKRKVWVANSKWVSELSHSNINEIIAPSFINTIYADSSDSCLYIGCLKGLYSLSNQKLSYLGGNNELLSDRINHIVKIDGGLLLSTEKHGLLFYDKLKGGKVLTDKFPPVPFRCRKVQIDRNGNVWMATNEGIVKLEKDLSGRYFINRITSKEGLLSNDIYSIDIIGDTIWVPTSSGVSCFNIHMALDLSSAPVYITQIQVDDSLKSLNRSLSISSFHNYIKISYNGLSYKNNGGIEYEYRLIGLDSNWKSTRETQVQFTTLPFGNYRFELRSVKNLKVFSDGMVSFSFTIPVPWFRSWWFVFVILFSVFLMLYILFSIRYKRLKVREMEKTKLVTQIMKMEMKVLRAQTNPHFIFNALNSIRLFVLKNDSDKAQHYLMQFARLMRSVLENSEHEVVSLRTEVDVLRSYIELESLRFIGKFNFEIVVSEQVTLDYIFIPPLLLQPIVENAIWHGLMPLSNKEGRLLLKIEQKEGVVFITIEDNGIGRKRSAELKTGKLSIKSSKGISITSERVDLYNKNRLDRIEIKTFDLDEKGISLTGTRVVVKIILSK